MAKIALIGGSGLTRFSGLQNVTSRLLETPYGETSAPLVLGELAGQDLVFLPRHGNPHTIPPHGINYRANLWALKEAGVSQVVAVNAVGGISTDMEAGAVCIPHQIIDYTLGREHTYSDSAQVHLQHVDFSYPYDGAMRDQLIQSAQQLDLLFRSDGIYGVTQGPRLETAAEIDRLERDGCHIVGMTGMPEAALARELDLPYAAICLVANRAAGRSQGIITMDEIKQVMATGMVVIRDLVLAYLEKQ